MPNNPNIPNPATLEEARELLLQYSNDLTEARGQVETLTGQVSERDATIEDLRTLNQKFFLPLSQGTQEPDQNDPEPQSLEEFAANLKGVINV